MTGSRVAQALKYTNDESFLLTYGDGLCDVDINKLIEFHKNHGKLATTSVVPDQKFGVFEKTIHASNFFFRETTKCWAGN